MRAYAAALPACALCWGAASHAATFAVIATVPGGPIIGAAAGSTVYGVTPGDNSASTLFRIGSGQTTLLHSFDAGTDGGGPTAPLAIDSSGNLSGTAQYGGVNGGGTLWRYGKAGTFSVLHAFGASGDGSSPLQGPVRDSTGDLFGTNSGGAVDTNGNVFRLSAAGAYTSLHNFLSGADGHCPFSGLTRDSAGNLFGTTVGNGFGGNPNGSVWKMSSSGTLTTLYTFQDGADGEWPHEAPVLDTSGNLYGTTYIQNGNDFAGALYEITAAGAFSVVHSFTAATDGAQPNSPLLRDTDGNIYGTTATGGPHGYGTVFSITPAGIFTVLHAFANGADGANPTGGLAHNASGLLFGGTATGQVFRIKP